MLSVGSCHWHYRARWVLLSISSGYLGYQVVGTSRSNDSNPRLEKLIEGKSLVLEKLDLLDVNAVQRVLNKYKPRTIFHLAGQSSVGMSFEDPEGTFSSIVTTTRNLLDASLQQSSDYESLLLVAAKSSESIKKRL